MLKLRDCILKSEGGEEYELIPCSEFLPELDLDLLVRCVLMPSQLEAMTEFLNAIRQ